jgi:hypothetical protein
MAEDPTDIFDDLEGLRRASGGSKGASQDGRKGRCSKRAQTKETFVRIPYARILRLYGRIGAAALFVLFEIDHLIFKARGQNPVRLTNKNLRAIGMPRNTKARAAPTPGCGDHHHRPAGARSGRRHPLMVSGFIVRVFRRRNDGCSIGGTEVFRLRSTGSGTQFSFSECFISYK